MTHYSRSIDAPRSPSWARHPLIRRHVTGLLCGWDVAPPRRRGRPSGARESHLFSGGVITKVFSKIHLDVTNATTTEEHLVDYIIRILNKCDDSKDTQHIIRFLTIAHSQLKVQHSSVGRERDGVGVEEVWFIQNFACCTHHRTRVRRSLFRVMVVGCRSVLKHYVFNNY